LYGFLKTLKSFTGNGTNHLDLIAWHKNIEPTDYQVQSITTESVLGYWCYSQLMSLLLPFILFINIRSRLIKMSTLELCAYAWLALGGALSVAFPLFVLRYHSSMQDQTGMKSPALRLPTWGMDILGICLWLSFWFTVSLSWSKDEEVTLYLWLLRFALFLPSLIPATPIKNGKDHSMPLPIYCGLVVLTTGYHWYQSAKVITHTGFVHHNLALPFSHDLMFCLVSLVLYILYLSKTLGLLVSLALIFITPFLSLGSTFSLLVIYDRHLKKGQLSRKED